MIYGDTWWYIMIYGGWTTKHASRNAKKIWLLEGCLGYCRACNYFFLFEALIFAFPGPFGIAIWRGFKGYWRSSCDLRASESDAGMVDKIIPRALIRNWSLKSMIPTWNTGCFRSLLGLVQVGVGFVAWVDCPMTTEKTRNALKKTCLCKCPGIFWTGFLVFCKVSLLDV